MAFGLIIVLLAFSLTLSEKKTPKLSAICPAATGIPPNVKFDGILSQLRFIAIFTAFKTKKFDWWVGERAQWVVVFNCLQVWV